MRLMLNIEALSLCESPEQIRSEAGRLSRLMGFEYWAYCEEGTAYGPTWPLQNLPIDAWLAYADYCARKENPLVENFRKEVIPSAWLLDSVLAADPLHLRCLPEMAAHFKKLELVGGLLVPVHDLGGRVCTLMLATCQDVGLDALRATAPLAVFFSKYLHESCRSCLLDVKRHDVPPLSPREVECLGWAAKGKTAWEIGRVLSISEHTAIFHLRNASKKLGTTRREQAVAKSISLGMLAA
jgi:LuxR family transcriptional regulator, quorum-sensing system regulator SolR